VSLLLLASFLWSLVPPEPVLSAPGARPAPLANLQLNWSPLDWLSDLLGLLGVRTEPAASTVAGGDSGLTGPAAHFGFGDASRLAQVTGTETVVPTTPSAVPTGTTTAVPTLTVEPTPGSTVMAVPTPSVSIPPVPFHRSRGELVPGRVSPAPLGEPPPRAEGGYRLLAANSVLAQGCANVQMTVHPTGQVDLAALGAGNVIQAVYFPRAGFTNAFVSFDYRAISIEILDTTYTLTTPQQSVSFWMSAVVAGQPTTVPLWVVDSCGGNGKQTLAGAGTGVGLSCLRIEGVPAGTEHNPPYIHAGTVGGVHTLTGNFSTSHTDASMAGRGPTPELTRAYNSNDPRPGPLGQGWTHSYAMHLARPPDDVQDLVLVGPQGRSDRYEYNAANPNPYTTPAGVYTTLVKHGDGTFTATHHDQSKWDFNACGRLTAITDRYGNQSSLVYDSSGRLTAIKDPAGRGDPAGALILQYETATGRLSTVTDLLSRVVRYEYYSNALLWKVTDRENTATQFGYDPNTIRLTQVTNARNFPAVRNTYDAGTGKVSEQKDALNFATGFTYSGSGATVTLPFPEWGGSGGAPTVQDTYQGNGWLSARTSKPYLQSPTAEWVTVSYGYDSDGNRTSATENGNTTLYCYDRGYAGEQLSSRGNLTRRILPPVLVQRPTSAAGVLTLMQPTSLYEYDARNNLIKEHSPRGVDFVGTINCSINLTGSLNGNLLYLTRKAYDARNQLTSVQQHYVEPASPQNPDTILPATTKYEYDLVHRGQVTKEIPPRGNLACAWGLPDQCPPDYTYATMHAYYPVGNPQAGLRESTTEPVVTTINTTTYFYDAVGRRTSMVEPRGNLANPDDYRSTFTYDAEDRLKERAAPAPTAGASPIRTNYTYDAVGNRTEVTDARGIRTCYLYDVRDLLQEVQQHPSATPLTCAAMQTDAGTIRTTYAYDPRGSRKRVTHQRGGGSPQRQVDYGYDGLQRLRQETEYPAFPTLTPTSQRTYTYVNGNLRSLTKPLGTITYTHDAAGRRRQIEYAPGPSTPGLHAPVTFEYDANGNRTRMGDGWSGATQYTTYWYDERDQLLQAAFPNPAKTVKYRYDRDGQRRALIYPTNNQTLTYNINKAGRVASLSDWAGRLTSYEYFPNGQLQKVTNVNATIHNRSYDRAGRVSNVNNAFSTGTVISSDTYASRDEIGNPWMITGTAARPGPTGCAATVPNVPNCMPVTYVLNYQYDGMNRLTHFDDSTDPRPIGPSFYRVMDYNYAGDTNQYAATHNRAKVTYDGTTGRYEYDGADRMVSISAPPPLLSGSYSYDGDGNALTAPAGLSIEHNLDDRMIKWNNNGQITNYLYDGDGRRIRKTGAGANEYTEDVGLKVPQLLQDVSLRYVYGPGGLAYATTANGSTVQFVYHADAQGSIRALTTYQNGVAAPPYVHMSTSYDPLGGMRHLDNPNSAPTTFGLNGAYFDPETQVHYQRARWYNPASGRFLQRDSVMGDVGNPGSLNRYAYGLNNPMAYKDPTGHFPSAADEDSPFPPWMVNAAAAAGSAGAVGLAAQPNLTRLPYVTQLSYLGNSTWASPAGLLYQLETHHGQVVGTRVQHVLRHTADIPNRVVQHGVFDVGPEGVFGLLDAAYQRALFGGSGVLVSQSGTRTILEVNMIHRVGCVGGQPGAAAGNPPSNWVRLVLDGLYVVSAYPFIP
jgi:RHS repeat-associated protein